MLSKLKYTYYVSGVAMTMGMMSVSGSAMAAPAPAGGGTGFNVIAQNINESIQDIPGLISGVSYLLGVLFAVLGVMKIKDHVENPTQTQLKDGAIRLAAGGALFAVPTLMDAMVETIGDNNTLASSGPRGIGSASFSVSP